MRIDLPPYAPDQSANSGLVRVAENVIRTADGYRPVGEFLQNSAPLPAQFTGGGAYISTSGNSYLLTGTSEGLYRYSGGDWAALVDGLTLGQPWRMTQFGNYVVAVNGGDTQAVDLEAAEVEALADAPSGTCITVIGDHVVIGQADGDILKVAWSAFNNHTGWTPAVNQAGFQPMLEGGEIMGLAGGEIGVILQRNRLMRMSRTGDATAPFAFDEIAANIGCAAAGSVAQAGRRVFFLSDRGFMICEDGQNPSPIGAEKLDQTFIREVPRDEWSRIRCAIDPRNTLVVWLLPGSPGRGWLYNWSVGEWTTLQLSADGVFAGYTSSDDIDSIGITDIDAGPTIYLDDPKYSGGAPRLFFVQGGRIGTLEGPPLRARIDMGFVEFAKGRVARLRSFSPVGDITEAEAQLDCRQRLGDAENYRACAPMRASGIMPVRASGRFVATSLVVPAGHSWRYLRAFEYEAEMGGLR